MSKRAIRLLIMLGVLALALGIYVAVVLVDGNAQEESDTATQVRLVDILTTDVVGISWTYEGEEIRLNKTSDSWQWAQDESCPVSTSSVESLINAFSAISAVKVVANAEAPEQYGLDSPTYQYEVRLVNGYTVTVSLGDYSSYAAGYYAAVSGDDGVYVVGEDLVSTFSLGIMSILQFESAPDLSAATQLAVTVAGRTLSLRYFADSAGMSRSDSYHWFIEENGKYYPASTDTVTGLLDILTFIGWRSCIAYDADEALLSQYGIGSEDGAEVTVGYSDAGGVYRTFTLLLGYYADSACYANIKGSTMLYTVSGAVADQFMVLSFEDLRATELCLVDIDRITSFSVELDGQTAILDYAGQESGTDENGELVSLPVWQRGGTKLDSDAVSAFTDSLTSMQTTEVVSGEYGRRQSLHIVINLTDGSAIDLAFYTYSSSQYVAICDGETYLVEAAAVGALIEYAAALLA